MIVTVWLPAASRTSALKSIVASLFGGPVVARLTNVTYGVAGETAIDTGSPAFAPGVTVTSTTLSLTTIGDTTTPVPPSGP